MSAAERALDFVEDGQTVGLGTGRAASEFVRALAERVKGGLRVRGVPTSLATERLAQQLGIPLVSFDDVPTLDLTVDGADEVDPNLDLIKGYGGALVREKIVAAASRRLVILVGPEKLVSALGERGRLPVEVVPFGAAACARRLAAIGYEAVRREADGQPGESDNGNAILDCRVGALADPVETARAVRSVPGVIDTGLFLGMASAVVIQREDGVEVRERGAGRRAT